MAGTLAKHIQVAITEGPEAGMEAFLAAPSSKRWPSYKAITSRRTPQTKLAAYCKLFSAQFDGISAPEQDEDAPDNAPIDVQSIVQAAVAAAVAKIAGGNVTEQPEVKPEVSVVTEVGVITRGMAWSVLNTDGQFDAPRNPDAPATNGQLYRLNVTGTLGDALEAAQG